jgi:hypothetical protein
LDILPYPVQSAGQTNVCKYGLFFLYFENIHKAAMKAWYALRVLDTLCGKNIVGVEMRHVIVPVGTAMADPTGR